MLGIIARWIEDKGFGFVRAMDGTGDYFFPRASMPAGHRPNEGDEFDFEFDPSPDPTKSGRVRPGATFVRNGQPVPRKAAPAAPPAPAPAAPAAARPTPAATAQVASRSGYLVTISTDDALVVQVTLCIAFKVTVRDQTGPVAGVKVRLRLWLGPKDETTDVCTPSAEPSTDHKGETTFQVWRAVDAVTCSVFAIVGNRKYNHVWQKDPSAKTEPATAVQAPRVAKAIKVFELGMNADGFTAFRGMTLSEDKPDADGVPADFLIESADLLEDLDEGELDEGNSFDYTSDEQGQAIVLLRPKSAAEAMLYFRLAKAPTKFAGPLKVRRKVDAQPADQVIAAAPVEPKDPPKVEKINATAGTYTFHITGAGPNSELSVEAPFGVRFRQADGSWASDKITIGADGNLTLELQVTTERARGIIRFRIGKFLSDKFYVVHPLPSL